MTKRDKLNNYIKENLNNIINSNIYVTKLKYKTLTLRIINNSKKYTTVSVFEINSYYNKYYKNLLKKTKIRKNLSKGIRRKFTYNSDILLNSKLDYVFRNILDYINYEL